MQHKDRIAIAVCAAIVVACLVHLVAPQSFIYYPVERVWRWERAETGVAMFWYGRSAWTLLSGALCFALTYAATSASKRELPPWAPRALALASTLSLALALALIAHHEWGAWTR
jgi:hypothetical protein